MVRLFDEFLAVIWNYFLNFARGGGFYMQGT